ncbi:unnamed protein product [Closterium sp. Naga37s-1]|nr:unnamed protein product [Closterium sp. Naga37s-1]
MAGRELKALLNNGEQGATYTATISIAGATVELPPEQRKCFSDDKHPFTATSFDFLACVVVRKCVSPSLQEAIQVVPSNVVADIVAGGEAAHVAFDGLLGCKLVAFCIWPGVLNDLDAVVGHDPAPRIAKPIARTLTTLRQDAKRAAEELAFRSRCGIADGHGGDHERVRSHEQPAGSYDSGRDAPALNTALALANAGEEEQGEGEQEKPDKEEGSSSDRDEDAPVNAPQGLGAKNAQEEADEAEGQGRGEVEGDAAEDDQRGDLELEASVEVEGEEDEEEEEDVEEVAANNAWREASAVAGAGKSIRGLQAVLSPRHGSATPSTEYAGKSPVAGKRKHSELVKMDPAKLAAEILRLDEQVKNQKRKLDELASAKPRRGGKRQKGPAANSVSDLLKKGGAVVVRCGGTTMRDAAAGPPPATTELEAGKGKAKVEDAPPTTTAITTAIVPAAGNTAAVAPGQPGPSSIAPAIPPSADVKAKNQGRGGCKPPPAALKADHEDDDDSDADDEVELVLQRFMGPSDTSGTSGKRKGCGIRPPPRGGEGMVGEPWLGGRRRWLGHHSYQEVQYLTAIAVMCYDKKIDPGLKLNVQQKSEWAEDISAAGTMCTGLFTTMHLRNLCGNVDRYHHMFKAYRDLTRPGSTLGNAVAWAAAVGKEAADEEPDVTGAQEGLFAGAVACAIAMVWETCNGLDLEGIVDAGYVAAQSAGTPEEKARAYVSIVTAVFKWARKESARTQPPEVTPKQVAEKIETAVVNRLGARLGDPTLVAMVAHEAVDVLMSWSDCKIAAKSMEANGLYLAMPDKRLSAKKRSA